MWENESIMKRSIKPPGIPYPIQSHIWVNFLLTVIYTFPKVLIRRICLTIKSFFSLWSFFSFSWPQCVIKEGHCKEKLNASHSSRQNVNWVDQDFYFYLCREEHLLGICFLQQGTPKLIFLLGVHEHQFLPVCWKAIIDDNFLPMPILPNVELKSTTVTRAAKLVIFVQSNDLVHQSLLLC